MPLSVRAIVIGGSLLLAGWLAAPQPAGSEALPDFLSRPGEPIAVASLPPVGAPEPPPVAWPQGAPEPDPLVSPEWLWTPPASVPDPAEGGPDAPSPAVDRAEIRYFVDRFTGPRREVVERWLARSGRYLPMILVVFRDRGLPDDLGFTAMIESGFNPIAVSRAGAKGLWQFMAPTARRYGLRVDRWLDERLDPEKATVAAARYLGDLYVMFGSWELVHAAYNAGETKVLRAMSLMGSRDFWVLAQGRHLRQETKDFVPAVHAAALIGRAPERYGFDVAPEEPLVYDRVQVSHSTPLERVAAVAGIPLEALERLNPELRLKQTPPDGPWTLKVPAGSALRVRAGLQREPAAKRAVQVRVGTPGRHQTQTAKAGVHVVRPRETVAGIARRHRVSVAELRRWNALGDGARIFPGDRLRVARVAGPQEDEGQGGFR